MIAHLYSNEGYDESEVWCGLILYYRDGQPVREPHIATCRQCLSEAASYGEAAMVRLKEIGP